MKFIITVGQKDFEKAVDHVEDYFDDQCETIMNDIILDDVKNYENALYDFNEINIEVLNTKIQE